MFKQHYASSVCYLFSLQATIVSLELFQLCHSSEVIVSDPSTSSCVPEKSWTIRRHLFNSPNCGRKLPKKLLPSPTTRRSANVCSSLPSKTPLHCPLCPDALPGPVDDTLHGFAHQWHGDSHAARCTGWGPRTPWQATREMVRNSMHPPPSTSPFNNPRLLCSFSSFSGFKLHGL